MKRLVIPLAALAASTTPAAAIPPPPEVAIVLLTPGGAFREESTTLLDALVQTSSNAGWFVAAEPPAELGALAACATTDVDLESCVRAAVTQLDLEGPPLVVVATRPGPGFHFGWLCIGQGSAPTDVARQSVGLSPERWDDASARPWEEDRAAAAGCILGAAAESGW